VAGMSRPGEDPYRVLEDPAMIRGRFQFDFTANPMNTSKLALQEALGTLAGAYLTPLALQMGVVTPDGAYQLLRDIGKSFGQDADKYLSAPSPESMLPKMLAEEVITSIMSGELPNVRPLEPPEVHMQKIMDFAGSEHLGLLSPAQTDILKVYLQALMRQVAEDAKRQSLIAAAGGGGAAPGQEGVPGPVPGQPPARMSQAPLGQGELADETMPGAGGGGNPGPGMIQ